MKFDVLSYGKHSALGNTLDVPEERDPPEDYDARHAPCLCGHLKYLAPARDRLAGRYYRTTHPMMIPGL